MTLQASAEDIENARVWRRMWFPWPQLVDFLKSLRFWHYRKLYLYMVQEHAAAGYDVQQNYRRAERATLELRRLQAVLAPYGEKILTGQAEGTTGPIVLPALEYEMARAFFERNSSRLTSDSGLFDHDGYFFYNWHGREVRKNVPEVYHA